MNRTIKILTLLALAAMLCFGQQYTLSTTTLSSAVATPNTTTINLSTTGMLSSGPSNQINTALYVDRELMWVTTVVDSTHAIVQRGKNQTRPFVHASGATVYFNPSGSPITIDFFSNQPDVAESWGSCLASNEQALPKIYVTTGDVFDCKRTGAAGTSGQWVKIGSGSMMPAGQTISAYCTGQLGSGTTNYLANIACASATANTSGPFQIVTSPGTLANLYARAATGLTGTSAGVLTLQLNGTDTAITCTFVSTVASGTTCSDTTHSVQTSVGDYISFKITSASSDAGKDLMAKVGLY